MKGIAEEDLMSWFKEIKKDDLRLLVIGTILLSMCKEIDTLTVSHLRPMVDAEDYEDVIAYKKFGDKNLGFIVYRGDGGIYYCRENAEIVYKDDELIGHVPMIIYKPEKE